MKGRRRTAKASRAAASLGANLMLAPAVMAMRLPLMAAEAGRQGRWPAETVAAVSEKAAAAAQGMAAAQMSLALAASRFWIEAMAGGVPSLLSGAALDHAAQAALAPSGKAVRRNFRRLSRRRK